MSKTSLVVLRGDKELEFQTDTMYPNTYYRSIQASENDYNEYIVYGIKFDQEGFDKNFEYAYDKIMRDWETIGLIKKGKLISKKAFNELASVHLYGKQTNNLRIIFFGHPRENMYGFYPKFRENQAKQLLAIYQWCINVIDGDMSYFDFQYIQFGNCGIPLSYGNLRTCSGVTEL
jgi:hypothetical protein